jgi:hypothetical protein
MRESTSGNQANGSLTNSQEVTKLLSTAAVRPPRSLPKGSVGATHGAAQAALLCRSFDAI